MIPQNNNNHPHPITIFAFPVIPRHLPPDGIAVTRPRAVSPTDKNTDQNPPTTN